MEIKLDKEYLFVAVAIKAAKGEHTIIEDAKHVDIMKVLQQIRFFMA